MEVGLPGIPSESKYIAPQNMLIKWSVMGSGYPRTEMVRTIAARTDKAMW